MSKLVDTLIAKPENKEIMQALMQHDLTSYKHSVRVAEITEICVPYINNSLSIHNEEIVEGALLHDVGKLFIPSYILTKNGKLTDFEKYLVEHHPEFGAVLLNERSAIIRNICFLHHKRINGSGYPDGICGSYVPDYVRMVTTVDVYEALTSDRPYKKTLSPTEAISEMQKMPEYDPWFFQKFFSILKEEEELHIHSKRKDNLIMFAPDVFNKTGTDNLSFKENK